MTTPKFGGYSSEMERRMLEPLHSMSETPRRSMTPEPNPYQCKAWVTAELPAFDIKNRADCDLALDHTGRHRSDQGGAFGRLILEWNQ